MAAFTICVGIRHCPSLEYVCLDGNRLGEAGARALIAIPLMKSGSQVAVSSKGCDITLHDGKCWFNYLGEKLLCNLFICN